MFSEQKERGEREREGERKHGKYCATARDSEVDSINSEEKKSEGSTI